MYFFMQYNAYFYCMMMLGICLITFLATVTKKRKIQTIEKKISTPFMPLNDSTSTNKEANGKYIFSSFQEEEQHEQGKPINSDFSSSL